MNTARSYSPRILWVAKATLAVSVIAAALVFVKDAWAAVGNNQICAPSTSCTIGEFLYDDSYNALNTATCTITSRYPDGTIFLNAQSMTHATENDGWYFHTFTAPSTTGLYRTTVSCTVNSQVMTLDKSFEVKTDSSSAPTASEVAAATWSYSTRSLSTFGSLVSDIWNAATRTLTGVGLSSGSIATKADVDSVGSTASSISTKADDIKSTLLGSSGSTTSNNVTNIYNETLATRNLLEQTINKPILENSLENGVATFELESKIDNTRNLANNLRVKVNYLKSKSSIIYSKWLILSSDKISKSIGDIVLEIGSENDPRAKASVLGAAAFLSQEWDWQETEALLSQGKTVKQKILALEREVKTNGKSLRAQADVKSLIAAIDKFDNLLGNKPATNQKDKTVFNKINKILVLSQSLDKKTQELGKLLSLLNQSDISQLQSRKQVEKLSSDINGLNLIPKIGGLILSRADSTQKGLKNKVLSLIGVIDANKKFLAKKPQDTFSSTWLELGSIVFKTLITNPSAKISQDVPIKYYLPREVKREHVVSVDEVLTLKFDVEQDAYYVIGEITLTPLESKTISITVDDKAFEISEDEIAALKKQAEALFEPLKKTSYFAQGVTLKSDIDVALEKIISMKANAQTPEEKIRSYREAMTEYKGAKTKTDKLKELVTTAGSAGTFFGFVGGAQTLAVWGMIIIMVTGFVFLALYIRSIQAQTLAIQKGQMMAMSEGNTEGRKEKKEKEPLLPLDDGKPRGRFKRHLRFGLAVFALLGIAGTAIAAVTFYKSQAPKDVKVASKTQENPNSPQVLGGAEEATSGAKIKIIVPEDSKVTLHKNSSLTSQVVITLEKTQDAEELGRDGTWVKITFKEGQETVTGWVDADFVEGSKETLGALNKKASSNIGKTVIVNEDLEGYLRVRSAPIDGEVMDKIKAGDKFPYISEENGWIEIELPDGATGWVSEDFVTAGPR